MEKITENIIYEVMNNNDLYYDEYYDEIKRLYEFNNYETDMLVVEASDYKVTIDNEHKFFGLISSLTNKTTDYTMINLLGLEFKVKKSSKITISVEAKFNSEDEIELEYVE